MTAAEPLMRGTFTFLFSDIEGSTATEARIGRERYAELRERHRALLRDVWEANDGQEEGTEGDSFFVAFREAPDGHRGRRRGPAGAGRRTVAGRRADPGPDGDPQRRRRADRRPDGTGGNLVGVAINRAARLAAVAHGGQILATGQTQALLIDDVQAGVTLRDLGEHRLRDLAVAGPHLPGRRRRPAGRVPADPDARRAAEQPADPAHDVHRSRRGAGRGGRPARNDPAADPDRTGRDRQDAALAPARGTDGRGLPGRRLLRRARAGPRADARGAADRRRGRRRGGLGPPDRRAPRRLAARQAAAAGARQLRAGRRRRPDRRRPAPRRAGHQGHRDEPGRAAHLGRAGVPGPGPAHPAGSEPAEQPRPDEPRRRGARRRSGRARPVRGGPPVHRAGRRRQARVRRDQRERAGRRGHQRPSPRDAAGHRAGRGPDQDPLAGRDPGPPRQAARRPRGGGARPARPAADAARRDRLELRPARHGGALPARPAVGLRERLRRRPRPRRSAGRPRRSAATSSTGSWRSPTRA